MKDFGKMTKLLEKEDYYMQMEILMKVNGLIINLMDLEYICTRMEQSMKGIGKMTNSMEKVNSN